MRSKVVQDVTCSISQTRGDDDGCPEVLDTSAASSCNRRRTLAPKVGCVNEALGDHEYANPIQEPVQVAFTVWSGRSGIDSESFATLAGTQILGFGSREA
jgi:hypothetical protein